MRGSPPAQLRARLAASTTPVRAPGVVDGLAARLAAARGFEAVYVSGAGTAAARGLPDMGLLTLTELVDAVSVIVRASGLPALVDADTGFGGPLAIRRTAQALADAGAAGLQIEDQPLDRRCGYLTHEPPVPVPDMLRRLESVRAADTDLVVVARTDALLTEGLDAAVERAIAYCTEGVDLLMVNGVRTLDDLRRLHDEVGFPMLHNVSGSDRTPDLDTPLAQQLDVRVVIYPIQAARAAAQATDTYLASLHGEAAVPPLMPFGDYMDAAGWSDAEAFDDKVRGTGQESGR
jgi:2-methylisocitrate lyase-like PEP mutase family enzyme